MQQRHKQQQQSQRIFTATEVAEYEYCPLVWWHEQYEPLVDADTEELFARMVELEHEHDSQAPALPEYQVIEQLLVRRGAFEEGLQQHLEHAEQVAAIAEERITISRTSGKTRLFVYVALAIVVLALLLMLLPALLPR
jgi:hypothetical protein